MRRLHVQAVLSLAMVALGCVPGRYVSRAEEVLVVSGDLGGLDCRQLGFLDETDGAMAVRSECDCAHPDRRQGTEQGLHLRLRSAAAGKGGNAVWILRSWESTGAITHNEGCCSVRGYRALALAYRCPAESLEYERRRASRQEGAGAP
jgi:hypothetical protein